MKNTLTALLASTLTILTIQQPALAGAAESSHKLKIVDGINPENMDETVPPGKDFYLYANGKWLKSTPIPSYIDRWGVLNIIREQNLEKVKTILEKAQKNASATGNEKKLGDFYYSAMNKEKIDKLDLEPIKKELKAIDDLKNLEEFRQLVSKLHLKGVGGLFYITSGQDFKDSEKMIGQLFQGGLGLPDRDYYTKTDKQSKELLKKYKEHVTKMFALLEKSDSEKKADTVLQLETAMAKASMKNTDMRDPYKIYHKMSVAEVDKLMPNFTFSTYLKEIGHQDVKTINVGQPDFFKALNAMLEKNKLNDWKLYLKWHVLKDTAPYLSSRFVDENFNFYGKTLTGTKENLPRWRRSAKTITRYLGEAIGQQYVKDNFTPEAKTKALRLVNVLKDVLRDDLENLEWMDKKTRKNAIKKMNSFGLKIGYPDKWRDYSKLSIDRDSYLDNIFRGETFEFHRQLAKIGKPVDRTEWFMNAQTVNAYYSAEMNEIVFPAGILQPPIFNPKADDATNLGAMGMVIGHEMTHGFDDQGSKFDGKGNLKNWWSEADLKRFKKRIALIEQQYEGYTTGGGTNFKGKLVAGEAAADLGGLTLAYKALKKLYKDRKDDAKSAKFSPEQRFFLSFAQAWATNIRPEKERMMTAVDPHPTPHFRVNGTLANMDDFERAFPLEKDSSMMLPKDKRCRLW